MADFTGEGSDDSFAGTPDVDTASGGGGNDTLNGLGANDSLDGGIGDDRLDGGEGDDVLIGAAGSDLIDGGAGGDRLFSDVADPAALIANRIPAPSLDQGAEVDTLTGGHGSDFIFAGYGDNVDGGSDGDFGGDTLFISLMGATSEVDADFRVLATPGAVMVLGGGTITNVESIAFLEGSKYADTLSTYGRPEIYTGGVFGQGGDDHIIVGSYATIVSGGEGNDLIEMAPAAPSATIRGEAGDDTLIGNEGVDVMLGDDGNDVISGNENNDTLMGGEGDDVIDGGSGDDVLNAGGGHDVLKSGAGTDLLAGYAGSNDFYYGAFFDSLDLALGGVGADRLNLQGDYVAGVTLTFSNFRQVETIALLSASNATYAPAAPQGTSYSYRLTLADSAATVGTMLTVDGRDLRFDEAFTLDASQETDASLLIYGGASSDTAAGGGGNDVFLMQQGGADQVSGGDGNDGFYFGFAFDDESVADAVDGGAGTDTLALRGLPVSVSLAAVSNVEVLLLMSRLDTRFEPVRNVPHNYAINTADSTVDAGATLTVQATSLMADEGQPLGGENLTFNGSAESDGNFRIFAGRGVDTLIGGAGSDGFFFGAERNFGSGDIVEGGGGTDTLALRGNYSLANAASLLNVTNVEVVALLSGHTNEHSGVIDPNGFDYEVWLYDVNVAAGGSIDVNGSGLGVDETLVVDGRDEKDGSLRIFGGAAGDTLYGGAGSDMLFGGLGSDVLIGGEGADLYVFRRAPESTSTAFDRIEGFDWTVDRIDAPGNATRAFSQSAQGALSLQSFDADLAAGLSGVLGPEQAALFTASTGDLSGQLFAVIDVNGIDGYQAGEDLVIRLATGILPIDPNAFIIV